MSNIAQSTVRNPDPRVLRSTRALGRALIELIQERDFDDITVQQILDRAAVGRATFYAHFRNKEDVLHTSYERLFMAFDSMAERPSSGGPRLFPVTEFLDHVREAQGLIGALRGAGRLDEVWFLFASYAARTIQRRLDHVAGGSAIARPVVAHMLAGALVEATRWWQDHPSAAAPAEIDTAFHELAQGVLRGPADRGSRYAPR